MNKKYTHIMTNLLPVAIQDSIKVLEVKQNPSYNYYNKYDCSELCSNIAFKVEFKSEIIWVNLYHGIGFRHDETKDILVLTKEFVELDEDLYYTDSEGSDAIDELKEILEHFYLGNEDKCLQYEDNCFIENNACTLENIQYIIFDRKIDVENPNLKNILEMEDLVVKAKEAYRETQGKKILQVILDDNEAPAVFIEFLTSKKIENLSLQNVTVNEEYMPDWGHLLVFSNAEASYIFQMNSSDEFTDEYDVHVEEKDIYYSSKKSFNHQNKNSSKTLVSSSDIWDYLFSKVYIVNMVDELQEKISI